VSAFKIYRWIEDALVDDKCFALSGSKVLLKSDIEYEVIIVDASEILPEAHSKHSSYSTIGLRVIGAGFMFLVTRAL
jgi:hypothetical protein